MSRPGRPPLARPPRRRLGLGALALLAACGASPGGSGPTAAAPAASVTLPAGRPLTAAFLVVDGVYNTELVAPWDVFEHTATHAAPDPGIAVFTVSPDGRPVTTAEGLRIEPDHGFEDAPAPDILVVPSAEGSRDRDLEDRRMIDWVRQTGGRAQLVMSLCWGAFVLAEAGLLDGRAATTFPADYGLFAQRFPGVDLRINVSFVHDGRAVTSEGGVRSFDAAMYVVERLFGDAAAHGIGRGLLIDWPPRGRAFISDPSVRVARSEG